MPESASRSDIKFDLWERKLLDLTTRNALLNTRLGSNAVPLFVTSATKIEDLLSSEKEYMILPRAEAGNNKETNEPVIPAKEYGIEDLAGISSFAELLTGAADEGKLYCALTEKDTDDKLKKLYRDSRTALDEDGAGTLYLACGFLKWKDDKKDQDCFAPVVLVPVELVRKFGAGRYVMRKTDDDTIVNITLLEKLKQDLDIIIPELEGDIPPDESGADVQGVFDTLKNAVSHKEGFTVIDACVLGMFRFSQFVMWHDLHNYREQIGANKIVQSLIEGHLTDELRDSYTDMEAAAGDFSADTAEENTGNGNGIYLPISADQSQAYAIYAAKNGASFVLHGPPGTGKSQTITSMIANAIADGKKVLFAAEKKAALDVVYSRLNKIGIAPFCLELHSNKVRKGYVLDQLKEAAEVRLNASSEGDYNRLLADISARRAELDEYARELTDRRGCGYSLFEMLGIYGSDMDAPDVILEQGFEDGFDRDRAASSVTALEQLIAAGQGLSGKLPYVKATEYSQETKIKLPGELAALEDAAGKLEDAFAAAKSACPSLDPGSDTAAVTRAADKISRFFAARRDILQTWDTGFLAVDPAALKTSYDEANSKWGPLRSGALKKVYNTVKSYDKSGHAEGSLEQHINALSAYKNEFGAAGFNVSGNIPEVLPSLIAAFNEYKAAAAAVNSRLGTDFDGMSFDAVRNICADLKQNESLIRPKAIFNKAAMTCRGLKLSALVDAYSRGDLSEETLIPAFSKAWSKLMIVRTIDSVPVLSGFSGQVFDKKIEQLKDISDEFEKLTRQEIFYKVAARRPDINAKANTASAMGILQKAIKSRGRGISIRSLMSQIEELILNLTPCVLMSPMSAAQFIEPKDSPLFDLIIFDEASQLPTCKAAGLIARGKEAVIVGDPNQMPPTSFFREQIFDEENYDTEDLESILDDCLAAGFPQTKLLWHYRSRHESLITFSNRCFYEGKLYTFPSADDRISGVTCTDCSGVFDSGKSRTNEKEAQAVVDELVSRSKDDSLSKYSCGVVTFNIQQQTLIEDMIDEACRKDPEFEKWAFGSEEPLFVKNLENVQGDERDVILFSVGYGPDAEGKVSMNFGPLNKDGGWRRLNVAVTRARTKMHVFCSLSPEQIKVSDATPEGVTAFRRFLSYAKGSDVWDADLPASSAGSEESGNLNASDASGIRNDICGRLRSAGYDADVNVGRSGFKVDIAVRKPGEDAYCLGILIDGSRASSKASAATREISQPSVLKGLGWKVMKVWSIDWWEDPDAVTAKCIDALASEAVPEPPEEAPSEPSEQMPEDPPSGEDTQKKTELSLNSDAPMIPYKAADIALPALTAAQFADPEHISVLQDAVKIIVNTEAPVCVDVITDRLCEACGIKRRTEAVHSRVDYLIRSLKYPVTVQNITPGKDREYDRYIVWKDIKDAKRITKAFREGGVRKADAVPVEEAACAAVYLARSQYGMPREDLVIETCRALGFGRADRTVKFLGEEAVDHAIGSGELSEHNGMIK